MTRPPFSLRYLPAVIATLVILLLHQAAPAQTAKKAAWAPSNLDTTLLGNLRGAKLTRADQLDSLRSRYGIHTIINLAKDALPKTGDNEIQWTRERGMNYIPIYLGSNPPSAQHYQVILEAVQKGGVYIHCAHGADRTGAVISRLRQDLLGWSAEGAYKEARRYGFKPWLKALKKWMGVSEK